MVNVDDEEGCANDKWSIRFHRDEDATKGVCFTADGTRPGKLIDCFVGGELLVGLKPLGLGIIRAVGVPVDGLGGYDVSVIKRAMPVDS